MTRLYIVRHGQTDWNAAGRITTRTDRPLTARGEEQARELGRFLAARQVRFDAAFASPMGRACLTAELALAEMGQADLAVKVEPLAAEPDAGPFEGWTEAEIAVDAGAQAWRAGEHIPGTEHDSDAVLRAMELLENLSALGGNVLLVSHGHFIRLLIAHAVLDIPIGQSPRIKIRNGSPSIIELDGPRARLVALNQL
jgi:broad specificity phosphatase PhoE